MCLASVSLHSVAKRGIKYTHKREIQLKRDDHNSFVENGSGNRVRSCTSCSFIEATEFELMLSEKSSVILWRRGSYLDKEK